MLKAGASKVNITPYVGGAMAGYAARDHGSEGIHDDLHAKALVLSDDDQEAALVTSDLIGVGAELVDEVRRLVQKSVGLPEDRVWVCASHTHFGPEVRRNRLEDDKYDAFANAYFDVLAQKMATAVRLAHANLVPARVGSGSISAEGISYNRRLMREDGKAEMSLTLPPPYDELRFGPVDPEVGVLKVVGAREGEVIAALLNFACHPVSSTDHMYDISADYPGYAMDLVERTEGGVCMFGLGCAGNIVPIQRRGRSKRQLGLSLGGVALKALQWIETTDDAPIRAARREIELPLREFAQLDEMQKDIDAARAELEAARERKAHERELTEVGERLRVAEAMPRWAERHERATARQTEIQCFWLGDIPLVGLPGEVFVELGMNVKAGIRKTPTFVLSLSNDAIGYVPIRQAYEEGGYEPTFSALAPGCGEYLVEEALSLVAAAKGQG